MLFKVSFLLVVAAAGALALQDGAQQEAAAEPYAYAYQTDSASASEQRSPDGKVTGYYTITDPADGRERRVEYFADETGFHAKVATNELGTKSENSADVEVSASPPSEAQLAAYPVQQQYSTQRQVSVTNVVSPAQQQQARVTYVQQQQAPVVSTSTYAYKQQQQQPTVYVGSGGSATGYRQQGATYTSYAPASVYNVGYSSYPSAYGSGYGYGNAQNVAYGGYGVGGSGVSGSSYNYHTPAQYYNAVQGVRYTTTQGGTTGNVVQPAGNLVGRYYYSGARTVPVGGYTTYTSSAPVSSTTTTRTVSTTGSQGSGNFAVLKRK